MIKPSPIDANSIRLAPTRRAFCRAAAPLLFTPPRLIFAQPIPASGNAIRPDVAAIDHDRILAAANRALTQPPTPLTALVCPRSPGTPHDYYSETLPTPDPDAPPSPTPTPPPFTAHRDALFQLGLAVPALAAAYLLTNDDRFAQHAILHLRAWFLDPATRMAPSINFGQVLLAPPPPPNLTGDTSPSAPLPSGRYQGILEALPLVEIAQAIPFLAASPSLTPTDVTAVHAWFAAYFQWLTEEQISGPRLPSLARDHKDHHATSWLLQACAFANLAVAQGDVAKSEDTTLASLRRRFRTTILRAQISPAGTFPHELGSATPYRDSLFNLDMLAGICQLLSTRFDSVWDYQLEDGPGMRSAIAYHFPYIASRGIWPFRADFQHFSELPTRRSSLLLSARAYQRPEYATLWKSLPTDPTDPEILRTIPIQQPLLWVHPLPRPA